MYQIVGRLYDYGAIDRAYFVVDTEEEAKKICDYANAHRYKNEEEDAIEEWYYTGITYGADNAFKEMRRKCHNAKRIKKQIKYRKDNLEHFDHVGVEDELVEEFKRVLTLLQAELAELE